MEIVKTLCTENPPFNSTDNYSLSFKLKNELLDMTSSYINIPIAIDETYSASFSGSSNPVGNVNIGNNLFVNNSSHVSSYFIRNVNLTADGQTLCYTNFINTLSANLSVYLYNNAEARFQEYMASEEPTVNEKLILANTKNHLYSSLYRELFNEGTTPSLINDAYIRLPLKQILGQYATEIRDLTKYQEVVMTLQLDDIGLASHANSDSYFPNNSVAGSINAQTATITNTANLSVMGYSAPIPGTGAGGTTFTFTDNTIDASTFPIKVGDTVNFSNGNNSLVITAVNVTGAGKLISLSVGANLGGGPNTILLSTVPTFGVFMVANATVSDINTKWLNKNVSYILNSTLLATFPNDSSIVSSTFQNNANVICILSQGRSAGGALSPGYLAYNGLALNYTGNTTVNAGTNIATVSNFTNKTFSFWVGQAVFITGTANVTPLYAKISAISYSGGKAQIQLNKNLVVGGGNVATLNLFSIHPDALEVRLPKKFELVQLKLNSAFSKMLQLSNKYQKWVYDGDVVLPLAPFSSYEKTFMIDPLTKMVVMCITKDGTLNSTKDTLSKYRILIDGMDTTNRDIDLNDESMKNERLISGFNSFYEDLHCVQTKTTNNPFSTDDNSYTILQEVPVDGKEHKLTVILRNGGALSTSSNLRVYKLVLAEIK
jgi:hypothetical protein